MRSARILLIACVGLLAAAAAAAETQPPAYLAQWGTYGEGAGQFSGPGGVATDAAGNVYVLDSNNYRVQKFTAQGQYLGEWGGFGIGGLASPHGIAADAEGNTYITDYMIVYEYGRLKRYSPTGVDITGSWEGAWFQNPTGVATDLAGNVYITDGDHNLMHPPGCTCTVVKCTPTGSGITSWGSLGSGDGQFDVPGALAVDAAGFVYVADLGNSRIEKFTGDGAYVAQWGSAGAGDGQFQGIGGVAVDVSGILYVADPGNNRVQMFSSSGAYLAQWGSAGSGDGQFKYPMGVATDAAGNVYVADTGNSRIQKFGPLAFPRFSDSGQGFLGTFDARSSWGDYDNDGDLDLVVSGRAGPGGWTRLYRNDAGTMVEVPVALVAAASGGGTWGDYDNDGDLDLLVVTAGPSLPVARVLRNDGNAVFTDILAAIPPVTLGSAAWGDCDGDGDLDIVLSGRDPARTGPITRVYRNEGSGAFADMNLGMVDVEWGAVAWGDYDNDGDLDVVITGQDDGGSPTSRVYRNDGHAPFVDIGAALPAVFRSSAAWGDYDADGDLDLLLSGANADLSQLVADVWRNDGGVFTETHAGLPGVYSGSVAWGDCDNDGDLDVLLTGNTTSGSVAGIYRNDGAGGFADANAGLPGVGRGTGSLADYDGDGDLDLLLAGNMGESPGANATRLYRSELGRRNTAPRVPDGPWSVDVVGGNVTLTWTPSGDAQTPRQALSYNLRVGTTPGGSEIVAPMASCPDGFRRVVGLGNAQLRTSWTFRLRQVGFISWSVQAIDGAFAGSAFSPERFFGPVPVRISDGEITSDPDRIVVSWYTALDPGAVRIYRRTEDSDWTALGLLSTDGTNHLRYEDTAIECGVRYGYRLGVMEGSGEVYVGEVWTRVPSPAFALTGVWPNPALRQPNVTFSLPDAAPARLEVFDIAGRRIDSVDVGALGAGRHVVRLGEGRSLAPGVYMLRLMRGHESLRARAVVLP